MKLGILAVAVAGVALGASQSRSIWNGVFNETQDKRGAAIYSRECSTCHGERLQGGEGAPALNGSDFASSWNGQTVGDLFDRIRQTMLAPPEQPGKLTPQQNADVVAHILRVNGFPAGTAELPIEIDQLKQIRIDPSKP
jgi:mono/diheme cytochrome c family protein